MRVLIVEDEPLGVERLEKQLREIDPAVVVAGVAESIRATVKWLTQHEEPDLILMDIELSDGQSFEIFRQVKVVAPIIFTTSYDEYALQAFKVNSIDYLLKPIKKEELKYALEKYRQLKASPLHRMPLDLEKLLQGLKQQSPEYRSRFLVKQGQRYIPVDISEIAYFYLEDRVTFCQTWEKAKYILDYSLDELETMLDPQHFKRVTRPFIVHIKAIGQIQSYFKGRLKLILEPPTEKEVVVSQEGASDFKRWMGK